MCVPALGMVVGLAGSAVSAMGAMSAAKADADQKDYNATVAKINARLKRQEGLTKQEDIGMKADRVRGQATAAAADGNIDPGYGSAAQVIFGEGAFAEATDKNRAFLTAESGAVGDENKAKDLEAQAKATRQAGAFSAAGSFLGGLGGAFKSGASSGGLRINEGIA